jgi:uncharacterized protein
LEVKMMNMFRCGVHRALTSLPLVLALTACAAPGPRAQPVPPAPADQQSYPDPLGLAAAHVEAVGGRAAIEAVRGYYSTGTAEMQAQGIRATVEEWVRPGEGWRERWDIDGFGRAEMGFDGRIAWTVSPDQPPDAVRDEEIREGFASLAVLHPETDLTAHLGTARTIGRRDIAGRSTWEVGLTGPAGSVQSRFYDEETGLLRAVERDELLIGQLTRSLTVYQDWRPIEGVLFPHRLTRTAANGPANGPALVTVLDSVTTESVPPEAVRAPAEVVAAASEDRYEVEVERNVMVRMRDGVRLAADVYRPRGAGDRLPVILIRTTYNKAQHATIPARVFAERGYAVLLQDDRGKWASEGEFVFPFGQSDRNDGYDTVEWIASQSWSNGRVGTYGCSRLGMHQYMLAAERHPAHAAMIPQAGGGAKAPNRVGGAVPLSAWVRGHPMAGTKDRTDGQVRIPPEGLLHLPTVDIMRHYGVGPTDWEGSLKPLDDPWWQTHGHIAESDSFATPALHVDSWYDLGIARTLQLFDLMRRNAVDKRTREHQYVIISPTTHCQSERATENTRVGELDVGDARLPYWQIYLDWFDHWLKGVDNGVTDMPRVQYYVMGANEWRSANEWPVPEARPTRLYLHSGGLAGERMDDGVLSHQPPAAIEPPDRYVYDPADPVPSRGGAVNPQDQPGAYDQSDLEQRADVLVYTTPPLDEPLDVVGPLRATLYVSSSAPDTDFTVKLVDVHPDGRGFNVQEGILRARYREGFDRTVWMRPGEVYEVEVDLQATAHRFRAGHRVRIEVSSSNFPGFDRNLNTGGDNVTETEWRIAENAIHHSPEHPSHLLLPVVGRW